MKRLCWVLGGALALVMGSVGLGPAQATPTAYAVPLSGITIDGQLDDWPAELTRYPIDWISPAYKLTPPAGPADFSAHFRVGYEAAAGLLYLAVEVEDDELVTRPEAPGFANQDLCEVYLEVEERGGEGAVVQYLLVPTADPLPSFWQGVPFPLVGNPLGVGDQPPPAGLQGAFQRVGTTTTYEWAIPLVAPGAEEPFPLPVGRRLGFDVALTDVDGQEEAGNWIAWSPGIGKRRHPHHLGSLILLEHPEELGRLAGTVTQADRPGAGLWVEVYQETRRVGVVVTSVSGIGGWLERLSAEVRRADGSRVVLNARGGRSLARRLRKQLVIAGERPA